MDRKVEVVPDQVGGFDYLGNKYEISAATDLVVRFVDHEYDHLRYLDPEDGIQFHFLGQRALAAVVAFGIPETRERLKMLESEHEAYLTWRSLVEFGEFEQEFEEGA